MPQCFRAADAAALTGQRQYLAGTRVRLFLIVGAAACGIATLRVGSGRFDLLGLVALLLFVGALVAELVLWREHPERSWYDGRALAESVKTLAWKYAVGGDPFPIGEPDTTARLDFVKVVQGLENRYAHLTLAPMVGEQITSWMIATRAATPQERRSIYIEQRIAIQQVWYEEKARLNRRKARLWKGALITLEVLGAAAALFESLTDLDLHFTPTIAAATGVIVAWLETKQHDQLARAYSTTVGDLASALTRLKAATTEADWAREMNDAEDAISREHTLWVASRSRIDGPLGV